jgi:hypothetical protein
VVATRTQIAGLVEVPGYRWVVRRADGTVVGTIHHSARPLTVVDVAEPADPEEAEMLRLIGVCLAAPPSPP